MSIIRSVCLNSTGIFVLLLVKLNGSRCVTGILRGFDPYMNLVLDECVEERSATQKYKIGMVVSQQSLVNGI